MNESNTLQHLVADIKKNDPNMDHNTLIATAIQKYTENMLNEMHHLLDLHNEHMRATMHFEISSDRNRQQMIDINNGAMSILHNNGAAIKFAADAISNAIKCDAYDADVYDTYQPYINRIVYPLTVNTIQKWVQDMYGKSVIKRLKHHALTHKRQQNNKKSAIKKTADNM